MNTENLLLISICLAAVPLLIAVGTCYLKFSIVLSLMRSGFGTQQAPSGALITALSLIMSLVVMQPVVDKTYELVDGGVAQIGNIGNFAGYVKLLEEYSKPWQQFLAAHAGEREITVFSKLANREAEISEPTVTVLLASFVLTEIKKAFVLSFFLLIPFFMIDIIVANLLVAMGLTMMSPIIVSLPIKLLLFISTDGWLLLSKNLIQAYL
jgi:flagellar biosynthesis protein FliP